MPESFCQLPYVKDACDASSIFGLALNTLPFEMGRRLRMALVALICLLCPGGHVGEEKIVSFLLIAPIFMTSVVAFKIFKKVL